MNQVVKECRILCFLCKKNVFIYETVVVEVGQKEFKKKIFFFFRVLLQLADVLWQQSIPLLVCRSYGFIGYMRLVVKEHTGIAGVLHPQTTSCSRWQSQVIEASIAFVYMYMQRLIKSNMEPYRVNLASGSLGYKLHSLKKKKCIKIWAFYIFVIWLLTKKIILKISWYVVLAIMFWSIKR